MSAGGTKSCSPACHAITIRKISRHHLPACDEVVEPYGEVLCLLKASPLPSVDDTQLKYFIA